VFAGKTLSTRREARDVFLALGDNDARGLCFAALLSVINQDDDYGKEEKMVALLRRSAELGCVWLKQRLPKETSDEERFELATLAVLLRERDGFYWVG
jgi:hypothetical protein